MWHNYLLLTTKLYFVRSKIGKLFTFSFSPKKDFWQIIRVHSGWFVVLMCKDIALCKLGLSYKNISSLKQFELKLFTFGSFFSTTRINRDFEGGDEQFVVQLHENLPQKLFLSHQRGNMRSQSIFDLKVFKLWLSTVFLTMFRSCSYCHNLSIFVVQYTSL